MNTVKFVEIEAADDSSLKYAVIVSQYKGKWIYCRHKNRNTFEIPGGRREPEERIEETARRELFEETGATDYRLFPISVYCVEGDASGSGLLCFASINEIGPLPPYSEISSIHFFEEEPDTLTYPDIQPILLRYVKQWLEKSPV